MLLHKITNTSSFIRECVVVGLLQSFNDTLNAVCNMFNIEIKLAKDFYKINLEEYFIKNIIFNNIDKKQIKKIKNNINLVLQTYNSTKIKTFYSVFDEKTQKEQNTTANVIFNCYVLFYLNKIAIRRNFFKNCYLDYIQYFSNILTEFEGEIWQYLNNMENQEEHWQSIKVNALKNAVKIQYVFANIMPVK